MVYCSILYYTMIYYSIQVGGGKILTPVRPRAQLPGKRHACNNHNDDEHDSNEYDNHDKASNANNATTTTTTTILLLMMMMMIIIMLLIIMYIRLHVDIASTPVYVCLIQHTCNACNHYCHGCGRFP